jgi:hypothetical protein
MLKDQNNDMKLLTILSLLFAVSMNGQHVKTDIFRNFHYESTFFVYNLILNSDSSFFYSFTNTRVGSDDTKGKWKFNGDTLILYDYSKPWTIVYGQEARIDTLKNENLVELRLDNQIISISDKRVKYYIDGIQKSVTNKVEKEKIKMSGIKVWVNSNCRTLNETNSLNRVFFAKETISEINLEYDTYVVNNKSSNYFILFLSNVPIDYYPKELQWDKWIIHGDLAIPIECGEAIDYLKLKIN